MKCPNCNVNLVMSERSGVEIDYCPECRGVWLDRGELDKIIDKSATVTPTFDNRSADSYKQPQQYQQQQHQQPYGDNYKKKRKDSFLGDLFDF